MSPYVYSHVHAIVSDDHGLTIDGLVCLPELRGGASPFLLLCYDASSDEYVIGTATYRSGSANWEEDYRTDSLADAQFAYTREFKNSAFGGIR